MAKANVNGVELFHELTGEGEPLVLVHGSWGDHNNWREVVGGLAESFQVLTYDRRGHSQSVRPGDGTRSDDEDDLAALVEHLGLAPAHIAGNSFGASISLGLVSRRPELFKSLAVHEPPMLSMAAEDPAIRPLMTTFQESIDKVIDRLRAGDVAEGTRVFVEEVAFGPGAWAQLPQPVRETFLGNALTWLNEQDDPGWDRLDLEALSGYSGPALLSEGDQSPPWFPAIMGKLEQHLTGAQRHTFRGAGHVPHMSHSGDYVRTITDFIIALR